MSQFPYHFFEEYVIRTPLLLRRNFQEKANKEAFSDGELKEICDDPVFQEDYKWTRGFTGKSKRHFTGFRKCKFSRFLFA